MCALCASGAAAGRQAPPPPAALPPPHIASPPPPACTVPCAALLQYAFVIHTTNPTNGDDGEVYCEMVRGLGEAIVSGTVPGTALTFVARKDDIDSPRVGVVGWS